MSFDSRARDAGRAALAEAERLAPPPIGDVRGSRRRRSAIGVAAFGAIGAIALVAGLALAPDAEPLQPVATTPPTTATTIPDLTAEGFVPEVIASGNRSTVRLTLLDGSQVTLVYPGDLDLTSTGVQVQSVGRTAEGDRLIGVAYGTPQTLVEQLERSHGPAVDAGKLHDLQGGWVQRWEFPDQPIAYLIFDFAPWTAYVWDGMPGGEDPPMSAEDQMAWTHLLGAVTEDGYLVLGSSLDAALQLIPAASRKRGPDGPDIRIDGADGGVGIFINDCARLGGPDMTVAGDEVFAWCDPTGTLLYAYGDAGFQQRTHDGLYVEPMPGPNVFSVDASLVLPALEQATSSTVYLTDDTGLTVVDVDAGTVNTFERDELAPGDPLYRLVRRGDRLVSSGQTDTEPAVFVLDPDDPTHPVLLGEAWFFIPSADEERVWLAILDPSSPDTERALAAVREVTIDGEVTVPDVAPPDGRWPVAALDDGLLFQGDEVLELWDPASQRFLGSYPGPFPVAAWHDRLVTCTPGCDELHLIDLDAGTDRVVAAPEWWSTFAGYEGTFAPDGGSVAVPLRPFSGEGRSTRVAIVEFATGALKVIPGPDYQLWDFPHLAWSASGEWLFITDRNWRGEPNALSAYRLGDQTYRVVAPLGTEYYGIAAR